MTVDTSQVKERRSLRYESLDDALADAERLAVRDVHTVGNWSLGQILKHLSNTMNASIDGFPSLLPWPMRQLVRLLFKNKFVNGTMPSGFQLRKKAVVLIPDPTETSAGLEEFRRAIERLKTETKREPHPALGKLTVEEWNGVHQRHAELHMSFVVEDA
jgi:hypothetical protein